MTHPYATQPAHAFWRQAVAEPAARDIACVDPVVAPAFRIARDARIATAGSCFAQHVQRHLRAAGLEPFVTEPAHPLVPPAVAQRFGYGEFGARYGNVYTSRQLLQLWQRAHGLFAPADDAWPAPEGGWVDPFRPRVQPGGFASVAELRRDRERHLAAVRALFAGLDVFCFTLGLTETWVSRDDGAAYPVCPGVVAGRFDAARHALLNLEADDVEADLLAFVDALRAVNPRAKLVLTVSPVPLVATAGDRHVMVATALSKAVLRVAADRVSRAREGVAYFPSFEIVTGAFHRGAYFAVDLRSVTDAGVAHVMRLFLRHYLQHDVGAAPETPAVPAETFTARLEGVTRTQCDEEALAR